MYGINQVICHGIPDDSRILKSGDIMNIDVTVIKDGWHGDTSKNVSCWKSPSSQRKTCAKITQECLYKGIEVVKPGASLEISVMQYKLMRKKITTL